MRRSFRFHPLRRALWCAGLCLAAGSAGAVNINDDYLQAHYNGILRDYYDRADTMPNVAALFQYSNLERAMSQNCTGSLINSRMVLTAAHCVVRRDGVTVGSTFATTEIRFAPDPAVDGTPHDRRLRDVVVHPSYGRDSDRDLAVVLLDRPVYGLAPVVLADANDPFDAGDLVTIVGYGLAGTGTVPGRPDDADIVELPGYDDARRRIAVTQLGGYHDTQALLMAEFRIPGSPDDPNFFELTGPVPELQGQPEGGDSGGPLFIQVPRGFVQIGSVIRGGGGQYGDSGYGTQDTWTYLPYYLGWLADTMADLTQLTTVSVRAGAGQRAWSDVAAWQGPVPMNQFAHVSSDSRWVRGRYFSAQLDSAASLVVDTPVQVDALTLSHEQARLQVPAGQRLRVVMDTRLQSGALQVDGRLRTEAVHVSGGRLSGAGQVVSYTGVQQSGGTLSAGSEAGGVLSVEGDVVQGPAARTEVSVHGLSAGGHGQLQVAGRYQAHGELSLVSPSSVTMSLGQGLSFATATGGIYGAYTGVTSSGTLAPAGTRWDVLYGADRLEAYLMPASYAQLGAAGVADSANRRRVGATLEAVRPAAGQRQVEARRAQVFTALAPRSGAQLPRDLDQLGGAAYAALLAAAIQDSRYLSGQVSDVLASQRRGEAYGADAGLADERRQVWASMDARWSALDGDVDVRSRRLGWSAGMQYRLDSGWTVGAAAGYSQSTLRARAGMGDGRLRQGHLSLYAQRSWDSGWFTAWQVDGGLGRLHLSRAVDFLSAGHRASTSVRHLGASGLMGWASAPADQARWEATAGLRYQSLRQGRFDDDHPASASALRVGARSHHEVSTLLTVGGSVPWQRGTMAWRASGWLGWEHAFGSRDARLSASLIGVSYTQTGRAPGRDRLQAGLSLQADVSARSRLALRVQGETARGWQVGRASLEWRHRF